MRSTLERIPVRVPTRAGTALEEVIVVLREDGLAGLGEAALVPGRPAATALAAAERCARLDLEARRRGVRLVDLLGGARREGVECSALIEDARAADVAAGVGALAAAGFTTFKLKAANAGGVVDEERLGAARWAAGRGARLRIDFNGRLSLDDAARRLPSLLAFGVELFEQPLPPGAPVTDWARLAAAGIPVAADESLADPEFACELAAAGIGLAAKLATVGGPEQCRDLLGAAAAPVTLGSSHETSIGIAAALHVACSLERAPLACGLATRARLAADLATGLDADAPFLALPEGPGLGVELDPDALARYRVDT